jgi:hypothetical protein
LDQRLAFPVPDVDMHELDTHPVLESWNRKDHPDQIRLLAFLDSVERAVSDQVDRPHPWAVVVHIGLPERTALQRGHDLDNYLFPIARRLGAQRIQGIYGRKRTAASSHIGITSAVPVEAARPSDICVRTTASASSSGWKGQIHDACRNAVERPLPVGDVGLAMRFTVSTRRNWSTLWKPAIDALGPVLGIPNPARPYHPNDERIVDLSLQRVIDDGYGDLVLVEAWWAAASL